MFDIKHKHKIIHVLNGKPIRFSSFLRYVNAANTYDQQNSSFEQHNKRIYLRAIKRIPANTEVIAWYGKKTKRMIT